MGFSVSTAEEGKKRKPGVRIADTKPAYRIPEERYAAARILYESTPGMSFAKVSEEIGVSWRALEERSRKDGGWTKRSLMPPTGMTEAAQAIADSYVHRLDEQGGEVTAEKRQTALQETAVETGVTLRAKLIDRHRQEWKIIDMLLGEHVKARDFDRAKLTKITAEALAIKQQNERKAWGIESGDADKPSIVVIERD
jgi:hypothetical protein